MASCAVNGCYHFVDRDGLVGFCKEHRANAVLYHVEIVEAKLNEQQKEIKALDYQLRQLIEALRRQQ